MDAGNSQTSAGILNDDPMWGDPLTSSDSEKQQYSNWLAHQCHHLGDVHGAILLIGQPDEGPFIPVAVWPEVNRRMEYLSPAAQKVITDRKTIITPVLREGNQVFHIAVPVFVQNKLLGVVAVETGGGNKEDLTTFVEKLAWGTAWLQLITLAKSEKNIQADSEYHLLLDLVSVCLDKEGFYASSASFCSEVARYFDCELVCIGFIKNKNIRVEVLSNTAIFNHKNRLIQLTAAAMDEACDQNSIVCYPSLLGEDSYCVTYHHKILSQHSQLMNICSLPVYYCGNIVGVISFERQGDKVFVTDEIAVMESLVSLVGPILEDKRRNGYSLYRKTTNSFIDQLKKLFGPNHVTLKLVLLAVFFLGLFFSVFTVDYRVAGKSVIEGEIQRVIAAPFDGYIAEANYSAGDAVDAGTVLAKLDDGDISLEYLKVRAELGQYQKQAREAMAEHNRAEVNIVGAQLLQAQSKLALYEYQLSKTRLVAPFSGVIVSGDLSRSLGAPVTAGDVLFELAPLDKYRIIISVDEADIQQIAVGQKGHVALTGLPDTTLPLTVVKITPVAEVVDGNNVFRVEAVLESEPAALRPGMEGIGKITIEERKLIWVWTHKFFDWLKLWFWSWMP